MLDGPRVKATPTLVMYVAVVRTVCSASKNSANLQLYDAPNGNPKPSSFQQYSMRDERGGDRRTS